MAQKRLYALFDKAINAYLNPLVFTTDAEAIRWFSTVVNTDKQDNAVFHHYVDYALYSLAEMDDTSGDIQGTPVRIIDGAGVKEPSRQYSLEDLWKEFKHYCDAAHG